MRLKNLSVKEIGKEIAKAGAEALVLNPIVLLVLVIGGLIFLAVGIGIIIYYGLTTAIIMFMLSAIGVLLLHYTRAVDLNKQPILAGLPFIMLVVGYLGERLQVFSIQPLWITQGQTAAIGNMQPFLILLIILMLVAVASRRKK